MTSNSPPTVVFVHGFLDSGEIWRPVLDAVGERARDWLAPDLAGMGRLYAAKGPFTLDGNADDRRSSDRDTGPRNPIDHQL